MTSSIPAPPVPQDTDLHDFPFTPIYRSRLLGSEFHATASDAEWRAGVTLWLKSWDQVPAGSLPADEVALCRLAELGRDLRQWRRVAATALHGWFQCSDGRLYHRVVAEGVADAWQRKLAQRDRTEAARAARAARRLSQRARGDDDPSVTDTVTGSKRQRQGQGQGESPPWPPPSPTPTPTTTTTEPRPNGASHGTTRRACRLPADWQPSPDEQAFAEQLGLDPSSVAAEFHDYWQALAGSKGTKLDWAATFRNRCREIAGRRPRSNGQGHSRIAAALDRVHLAPPVERSD